MALVTAKSKTRGLTVNGLLETLAHRVAAWVDNRKALAELERLDPRMLDDIGLTRGDLAAWRTKGHAPHNRG